MLSDALPSYRQLYESLKQDIERGVYGAGDRLPSERALAESCGVGRQAVRQCLGLLQQEGLIITKRGSGSYVRPAPGWTPNGMPMLGLVVPDFSAVAGGLVMGVLQEAKKCGHAVIVDAHQESVDEFYLGLQRMVAYKVAAVLVIKPRDLETINAETLDAAGIPYILLMRDDPEAMCDKVVIDNVAAGEMATQALINYGCRNLMFLGPLDYGTAWDRLRGMRQALRATGVPYRVENVLDTCRSSHEQAEQYVERVIQEGRSLDGICAFNDTHAAIAMKVLQAHGIAVPEEVALVGMDDREIAQTSNVPITTIQFDTARAGAKAVSIALQRITESAEKPRLVPIEAHIVFRESCPDKDS